MALKGSLIKNMRVSMFVCHLVFQGLFVILAASSICLIAARFHVAARNFLAIRSHQVLYSLYSPFNANIPLGVLAQRSVLSTWCDDQVCKDRPI